MFIQFRYVGGFTIVHGATGFFAAVGVSALLLSGYIRAVRRQRSWPRWRVAMFAAGVALVAAAFLPSIASRAHHDLRLHMVQHLLLGMFSPIAIVLAAPLTLLLRSLERPTTARLVHAFGSPIARVLTHPYTAVLLNVGSMGVLYFTPLYILTAHSPVAHHLLHLHFFAAGCLFTWSIAGTDAIARRVRVEIRLFALFLGVAVHSVLAKLMYAYGWPRGSQHSPREIQEAAKLMYYGGDVAELILALVLFGVWYRRRLVEPSSSRFAELIGPSRS